MAAEATIGMRIKSLRESRGMSKKELADILGINEDGVSELESYGDGDIHVDTVKRVCETFHEYPSSLLFEKDDEYWNQMLGKRPSSSRSDIDTTPPKANEMTMAVGKAIERALGKKGLTIIYSAIALNEAGLSRAETLISDLLKIGDYRSGK